MVERLSQTSEKRDLLVLNFGLHFSETYKEELEQLVQKVSSCQCSTVLHPKVCVLHMHALQTPCKESVSLLGQLLCRVLTEPCT